MQVIRFFTAFTLAALATAIALDTEAPAQQRRAFTPAQIEAAVDEALAMPMPDGTTATDGVFAERESLLSDGRAPWSGFPEGAA